MDKKRAVELGYKSVADLVITHWKIYGNRFPPAGMTDYMRVPIHNKNTAERYIASETQTPETERAEQWMLEFRRIYVPGALPGTVTKQKIMCEDICVLTIR